MTIYADVVLCMLAAEEGGLVTAQESGTRSLYFHFGWAGADIDFGGFLDLEGGGLIEPGIGPVAGVLTMWAAEASVIEPGQAFSIRYPTRVVGYGLVREVEQSVQRSRPYQRGYRQRRSDVELGEGGSGSPDPWCDAP